MLINNEIASVKLAGLQRVAKREKRDLGTQKKKTNIRVIEKGVGC